MSLAMMETLLFDEPRWLQALWLLLPLGWLLVRAERKRRAAAAAFAAPALAAQLLPPLHGARPWLRGSCQLLGVAALLVASAGPRLGLRVEPTQQRGADLLVLLDVSRSMLSEDVAPNRLERARSDVQDLVTRLEGHRLGLVLFAGKALLACPLTFDRAFFLAALERAGPGSAPLGGTAIGDALRTALEALPPAGDREQALLLITDGEDHDSFPLEAARQAADRGILIFTVGLGDPNEGARVPTTTAAVAGSATFLKHDGQEVWSKMQEGLLRDMATTTGGAYVPARTQHFDLGELYVDHLAKLRRGDLGTTRRQRHTARFPWLIGTGLALLLAARLLAPLTCAPAARRLAALALLLLAGNGTARAGDAPAAVAEGIAHFEKGDTAAAIERFDAAAQLDPRALAIVFDRGCAKLKAGDRDGAVADFLRAATARDPALAAKARFNLGATAVDRAQAALGATPEEAKGEARTNAVAALEEAIGHYRSCLAIAPDHVAARQNLEKLKLWLKYMEETWARRDRERRREELDVGAFLDWLREEEGRWRDSVRPLAATADSPLRRTAVDALARAQRDLRGELPTLRSKLAKAVQDAAAQAQSAASGGAPPDPNGPPSPPVPPAPSPDPAAFEAALRGLVAAVDAIDATMEQAGGALAAARFAECDRAGFGAQQQLEALWFTLADLASLIRRGDSLATPALAATEPFAQPGAASLSSDAEAKRKLQELDARLAALAPLLAPHAQAQQGDEALAAVAARAIELAPAIEAATQLAAQRVAADDGAGALPPAQEAQRLLRELLDLLPKDDKQDDKQDEKKDEKKDDSNDPKQDPSQPEDASSKDEKKPPESPSEKDGERSPEERKEQAQTLVRRALERARQKADEQKKAQEAILLGRGAVDRDW